jgi:hypothetical protein
VRINKTFCARCAGAVLAVCVTVGGTVSYAQTTDASRGAAAFERANAAWARGDFDTSEILFKEALDQGGLVKKDTLAAYVFLGSARAVIGRKDQALAAFRLAGLIDPNFVVPAEAGKKASKLADTARRPATEALAIKVQVPQKVPAYKPFKVDVVLESSSSAVLSHVELTLSDGLTVRGFKMDQPTSTHVTFEVPQKVVLADANLSVKVAGLDARDNELVTSEGKVAVGPDQVRSKGAVVAKGEDKGPSDKKSSSLWATPWPYIVGGVVLAGAGAGAYFLFKPSDQVTVTQVQVQAVR